MLSAWSALLNADRIRAGNARQPNIQGFEFVIESEITRALQASGFYFAAFNGLRVHLD